MNIGDDQLYEDMLKSGEVIKAWWDNKGYQYLWTCRSAIFKHFVLFLVPSAKKGEQSYFRLNVLLSWICHARWHGVYARLEQDFKTNTFISM